MAQDKDNEQDDISWFPYILAVTSIVIIGIVVLSINQQNKPPAKETPAQQAIAPQLAKTAQNIENINLKILSKPGSQPEKIKLPHAIKENMDDVRLEYSLTLQHQQNAKTIYQIVPDDCVEKFEINGKPVDREGEYQQNRCNWQNGFNIDLKPYLKVGANNVVIEVKNGKGPTGFTINSIK